MGDYMASLEKLMARDDVRYHSAHGAAIEKPRQLVRGMMGHRKQRERQILTLLEESPHAITDMVPKMYLDTPEVMYPAAARSVLAAIEYLVQRGELVSDAGVSMDASYQLAR